MRDFDTPPQYLFLRLTSDSLSHRSTPPVTICFITPLNVNFHNEEIPDHNALPTNGIHNGEEEEIKRLEDNAKRMEENNVDHVDSTHKHCGNESYEGSG